MSIRFVHIRPIIGSPDDSTARWAETGGTTIAYVYNDKKRQIHYGVAHCSVKDKYSRPAGRHYAAGRINKGRTVSYDLINDSIGGAAPGYKAIAEFFHQLYGNAE